MPIEPFRVLLACAALTSVSCPGTQQVARPSLHADIGAIPPELRADFESFATNCSKCHDYERALSAPVNDVRHWDVYVDKMMRTAGSAIGPQERAPILRFLYWYTGQKNAAGQGGSGQASQAAPAAVPMTAPAKTPPPMKEETQAPTPVPNVTSDTEGESTP